MSSPDRLFVPPRRTFVNPNCPVPANALACGTKLIIGSRTITTWNATTKRFESMTRQAIAEGPTANKRFSFHPWQLV